jgi:rhodanese-related sulfurtransferase
MLDYELSPTDAAALLKDGKARLIDPEERLVVMCHHGMRSMNVTVWLRNQGFEQVQSLRGGIDAWSAEVDPAVPRY